MNGITTTARKRRRSKNDIKGRTAKAFHLTQVGELSSARHVLESSPVAPGNEATKRILTDEARRPSKPRSELDPAIADLEPEVPFDLDVDKFLHNLRTARKGCAGGPSGMTAEHLKVGLESPVICGLMGEVACQFARARMPAEVVQALRLGRITALQKPDGGVRGIVVGDVFRRLTARTMAQQFSKFAEGATHPFQYALSTRAGTECVTHIVQALTSENPETTILSVDGIGAYDLISRNAIFQGVRDMVDGDKMIPFIRQFYGSPSTFLWDDDFGEVHHVHQGEGGEQGDPLMPMLFSLGQHRALVAVQSKLLEDEKLFAFLDDVYVICRPSRVQEVFQLLETELRSRASISIHLGKTKLWNASGIEPTGVASLSAAARMHDPQAVVWRGDQGLPTAQQGLKVLGAPVGHPDFIRSFLSQKGLEHDHLLEMIPQVPDVQAAWLLLVFCASTRANFFLRTVAPEFTLEFAERHDEQVFTCLSKVPQTETLHPRNQEAATMPLTLGGLGLGNAQRTRDAAHWGVGQTVWR